MKRIWITWENHRRTIELASSLPGIRLFQFEFKGPRLIRYACLLFKTILIIFVELPNLVIVQNPSLILSLFALFLSKIVRFKVVVDAHNEGLIPFHSRHNWLMPIYSSIQKWAHLTIVTNKGLAEKVLGNGGNPFILEDKIPQFANPHRVSLKGRQNLVLVCTFQKDEPYVETIKAASFIGPSIYLYITGPYRKAPQDIILGAPPNVLFTGFLPDQDYINLLFSCDAVIDLTLMKDCLVCGAYEAVALGKPMIISDTEALRGYFSRGAVYTKNTPQEIANSIAYALENSEKLESDISLLKADLERDWNCKFAALINLLDQIDNC